MRIDIEHVRNLKAQLDLINRHPLHDIELYENGVKIETDKNIIDALEHQSYLKNFNIILDKLYKK